MKLQLDLRILADDLTGALDSAAAFDVEVPVYLDGPPVIDGGAPVSVVATATRDIVPSALANAVAPSITWLAEAGVAFKKVDSLLRGNTFIECAHVAKEGRFDRIVFAPAYPKQGRLTIDGRAVVLQPGDASAVPRPIGERSIAESFGEMPIALSVPEVRSDDDLLRVVRGAVDARNQRVLWCGSAGLAQAMAAVFERRASQARPLPAEPGPRLLVSASHHPVVRGQWQRLAAAGLTPIYSGRGEGLLLDQALNAMQAPFERALLDLSAAQPLTAEQAAGLLAQQIAAIAERAPRPSTLLVVGGDTLRALCRATGAHALVARVGAREGWGCARLIGGRWDGTTCHSRSGAFGPPDDLLAMCGLVARAG